jgi:hypothetical protein
VVNPSSRSLICDPSLPAFSPERIDPEMKYWALRCSCGGSVFRASSRPIVVAGEGGYFWRTLRRAWREARQETHAGEPVESPFALPVSVACDACGYEQEIFEAPAPEGDASFVGEGDPREAYRCRVCRRARVELVIGSTSTDALSAEIAAPPNAAAEVVARCHACQREARIAWGDARPTHQEVKLDYLYGRR